MEKSFGAAQLADVRKRNARIKRLFWIFLFIAPTLLFYGVYNVYSIARTIYFSFLDWNGIAANGWAGLGNWIQLFNDPRVFGALKNNLILVLVSICVQLPFALVLALLLDSKLKGVRAFRTLWFLPVLLSTAATAILWNLMYDPYFGFIQAFLRAIGQGAMVTGWLGNPKTALASVLIVVCWTYIPFYMILIKAGLTNVPEELKESANLDGANQWQSFVHVTFPLLLPTLRTAMLLNIVGSLKYFDLIWIMTTGGPNGSTELVATYLYKVGIEGWNMGYGSAIASFLFLFCAIFAIAYYSFTSSMGNITESKKRRKGGRKA